MDIRIDDSSGVKPQKLAGVEGLSSANNSHFDVDVHKDVSPEKTVVSSSAASEVESKNPEVDKLAKALLQVLEGGVEEGDATNVVARLNEIMRERERDLEFLIDDVTGKNVLKVLHSQSGDLIRQFPLEETLRVARFIVEGPSGLLDDMA